MSKVEGGGAIEPPSRLRVTIFFRRLLGLRNKDKLQIVSFWNTFKYMEKNNHSSTSFHFIINNRLFQ